MSRSVETPWKPGDDRHEPGVQRLANPVGAHLEDLGAGVVGVGDDAGLAAREGGRLDATGTERHAHEGHGDALAGGEQHVEFARRPRRRDVVGQADEVVGELAHGRHHHDDVVSRRPGPRDVIGDGSDAFGVADGRATELLNDQRHESTLPEAFGAPKWAE